jgi:N-acyl-D-amino-acid deacylase
MMAARSCTLPVLYLALLGCAVLSVPRALAEEPAKNGSPSQAEIKTAVQRGLGLVQKAAANYPKHRDCFSCHHQTLPMLAMVTAGKHGIEIDEKLLQSQADFSRASFADKTADVKRGKNVGGRAMTVGYAAWALALADRPRDETTEALAAYLLKTQRDEGHWTGQVSRPPLEESYFTCTVLAVEALQRYAGGSSRDQVDSARAKAKAWLSAAPARGQEDKASRLWGVYLLGGTPEELGSARECVLKCQRSDGGWAQLDEMESDAYATGQTLFVLQATGYSTAEPAFQHGIRFLLKSQRADGSWFVRSRSKPIQPEFDNGDPHGKDQFISTPATCWAVAALAAALEPKLQP